MCCEHVHNSLNKTTVCDVEWVCTDKYILKLNMIKQVFVVILYAAKIRPYARGDFTLNPASVSREWIVPQMFKLLLMRHICFDLVIRFITNRKYAFFCFFYVRMSAENIILIHWIKIDHVQLKWSWLTVVELSIIN